MLIVGCREGDHAVVLRSRLGHGSDPANVAYDQGFVLLRPLTAYRGEDGDLVVAYRVRAVVDDPPPDRRPPPGTPGWCSPPGSSPSCGSG